MRYFIKHRFKKDVYIIKEEAKSFQEFLFNNKSTKFNYADFTNLSYSNIDFSNMILNTACFDSSKLISANFSGGQLRGSVFCNADLRYCNFNRCDLTNAIFINSDLRSSTFNLSIIDNTDFTGSFLPHNFHGAKIHSLKYSCENKIYINENMLIQIIINGIDCIIFKETIKIGGLHFPINKWESIIISKFEEFEDDEKKSKELLLKEYFNFWKINRNYILDSHKYLIKWMEE
jgi:hypothetical protein